MATCVPPPPAPLADGLGAAPSLSSSRIGGKWRSVAWPPHVDDHLYLVLLLSPPTFGCRRRRNPEAGTARERGRMLLQGECAIS